MSKQQLQTASAGLFVKWKGKTYAVASLQDAGAKWDEFRDAEILNGGGGGSQIGNGVTVRDAAGKIVGKVSYNGRLWDASGKPIGEVVGMNAPTL